jgi:hypothetical protein
MANKLTISRLCLPTLACHGRKVNFRLACANPDIVGSGHIQMLCFPWRLEINEGDMEDGVPVGCGQVLKPGLVVEEIDEALSLGQLQRGVSIVWHPCCPWRSAHSRQLLHVAVPSIFARHSIEVSICNHLFVHPLPGVHPFVSSHFPVFTQRSPIPTLSCWVFSLVENEIIRWMLSFYMFRLRK